INGGEGNDSISRNGSGNVGVDATGIFNSGGSQIKGGEGNNSITGIGKGGNGIVNAAMNIRAKGIRMLSSSGTREANASGEDVRPIRGRKSKMRQSSVKLEAHTLPSGQCG
ncbi:MAG: hypothetical protein ACYTXL_06900, partial [Nostoc sp.]